MQNLKSTNQSLDVSRSTSTQQYLDPLCLENYYKIVVSHDLLLKQMYKNVMEIPQLKKITLSTSSKFIVKDKRYMIPHLVALEYGSGQKLQQKRALQSIATFKVRKNQLLGCTVTLRGEKMFAFFEKFIKILLPRLREFQTLNKDSRLDVNSLNVGINNFLLFPECENYFEFFEFLAGFNINCRISTKDKHDLILLCTGLQLPFLLKS